MYLYTVSAVRHKANLECVVGKQKSITFYKSCFGEVNMIVYQVNICLVSPGISATDPDSHSHLNPCQVKNGLCHHSDLVIADEGDCMF